jgi:hypothetical protein
MPLPTIFRKILCTSRDTWHVGTELAVLIQDRKTYCSFFAIVIRGLSFFSCDVILTTCPWGFSVLDVLTAAYFRSNSIKTT